MEIVETSISKGVKTWQRKLNKFANEWMKIFLDSSNIISRNDHDFINPYSFFRNAIFPSVNGYELFRYFYNNKFEKIPI
jgi:hypothetical protein